MIRHPRSILLDTWTLALITGVSASTLRHWARRGQIPSALHLGEGKAYFDPRAVIAALEANPPRINSTRRRELIAKLEAIQTPKGGAR